MAPQRALRRQVLRILERTSVKHAEMRTLAAHPVLINK
jgi:hypothetical protein